jgi:hypothetical protein
LKNGMTTLKVLYNNAGSTLWLLCSCYHCGVNLGSYALMKNTIVEDAGELR